jgi:hypothetical protein
MKKPPSPKREATRLTLRLTTIGHWLAIWLFATTLVLSAQTTGSEQTAPHTPIDLGRIMSVAGTFDLGYRATQFYEPHHNVAVGQGNIRLQGWLPPFREEFSWGPYLNIGGIGATQSPAWENAWLGAPGIGFQVFPFSRAQFQKRDSRVGNVLGPLRFFAEFNRLHFPGSENSWRPNHQVRLGAEYWSARHVNDPSAFWWTEIWAGVGWQSANEFAPHYDTGIVANAMRAGARVPDHHLLSAFTPYGLVESTLTDNTTYYWENNLHTGGGIRLAPRLKRSVVGLTGLSRFAVYGEYVGVATYYRERAPASVPDHDIRAGITFSLGDWYH